MSVGSTWSSLQNFSIPSIWILSSSSLNWSKSAAIFSWSTCGTSERPPLAKYESTAGSRFQSNRLSRSVATRSEAPVKVENCLTFSFCMRRAADDITAAVETEGGGGGGGERHSQPFRRRELFDLVDFCGRRSVAGALRGSHVGPSAAAAPARRPPHGRDGRRRLRHRRVPGAEGAAGRGVAPARRHLLRLHDVALDLLEVQERRQGPHGARRPRRRPARKYPAAACLPSPGRSAAARLAIPQPGPTSMPEPARS